MGKTVWRALADVIVVFLAIALAQIGGRVYPPTNAAATMLSPVSPLSPEEQAEFEERVVYLTNLARRQVGLPPLKENPRLGIAARGHSQDMADHDYFGHTGSDGSTLADRLNESSLNFGRSSLTSGLFLCGSITLARSSRVNFALTASIINAIGSRSSCTD